MAEREPHNRHSSVEPRDSCSRARSPAGSVDPERV